MVEAANRLQKTSQRQENTKATWILKTRGWLALDSIESAHCLWMNIGLFHCYPFSKIDIAMCLNHCFVSRFENISKYLYQVKMVMMTDYGMCDGCFIQGRLQQCQRVCTSAWMGQLLEEGQEEGQTFY